MSAVFVAKRFAPGQQRGEVGVAVGMAVGHAASPQNLRRIQQRLTVLLVFLELIEEVTELLDEERVRLGRTAQLLGVAQGLGPGKSASIRPLSPRSGT